MSPNTEAATSRIDADSKAKLEQAAEECDLSLSAYLREVLEKHIDQNPNGLRALESHASGEACEMEQSLQGEPADGFVEGMLEDME